MGLFQPTASPRHLLELIQMPLERLSLPAAVTGVCLRAPLTAPLPQRQQELFVDACQLASHGRLLAGLIDRLSSRLGEKAVVRPRLVADAQPELAWRYDSLVGGRGPRRVAEGGQSHFCGRAPRGAWSPQKSGQSPGARRRVAAASLAASAAADPVGRRFACAGRSSAAVYVAGPGASRR